VKTDAVDATTLAQLLRRDLIPEAHLISPELREPRDLRRQRLVLVAKRPRCRNAVGGLLAQDNVAGLDALPPVVRFQAELHLEQRALLTRQIKRLEHELHPVLVPTAAVQRLRWIPGIGKIGTFTLYLEIDGIARFSTVRSFFPYCRLVPGAKNSGGTSHHKRSKDGNRYLKLAFSHAAVRAIQYYPESKRWYERKRRAKGPMIARALVAKELARIVYYVLKHDPVQRDAQGHHPLSHQEVTAVATAREPLRLTGALGSAERHLRRFDWAAVVVPPIIAGRAGLLSP